MKIKIKQIRSKEKLEMFGNKLFTQEQIEEIVNEAIEKTLLKLNSKVTLMTQMTMSLLTLV